MVPNNNALVLLVDHHSTVRVLSNSISVEWNRMKINHTQKTQKSSNSTEIERPQLKWELTCEGGAQFDFDLHTPQLHRHRISETFDTDSQKSKHHRYWSTENISRGHLQEVESNLHK